MKVRQTLILVVMFLLGVLTAGALIGRPVAAEPKADATAAGRYQIVPVGHGNSDGTVEVMDTGTGECWSGERDMFGKPTWIAMGVPSRAK